ncbi:unnamed protein product, partial [Gordionus sp. m RMFG-2023]
SSSEKMLQFPRRGAPPSPMFQTPKGDPGIFGDSFRQRMAGSKRRKKRANREIGPVATSVPQGLIASMGRPLQNVQDCDVSIPLERGSGVSVGGDVLQRAVCYLPLLLFFVYILYWKVVIQISSR